MRTTVMCVQCHDDLRQAGSIPDQGHYDGALDTHIVAEFGNDWTYPGSVDTFPSRSFSLY
jgi:hypothetical protein